MPEIPRTWPCFWQTREEPQTTESTCFRYGRTKWEKTEVWSPTPRRQLFWMRSGKCGEFPGKCRQPGNSLCNFPGNISYGGFKGNWLRSRGISREMNRCAARFPGNFPGNSGGMHFPGNSQGGFPRNAFPGELPPRGISWEIPHLPHRMFHRGRLIWGAFGRRAPFRATRFPAQRQKGAISTIVPGCSAPPAPV